MCEQCQAVTERRVPIFQLAQICPDNEISGIREDIVRQINGGIVVIDGKINLLGYVLQPL